MYNNILSILLIFIKILINFYFNIIASNAFTLFSKVSILALAVNDNFSS